MKQINPNDDFDLPPRDGSMPPYVPPAVTPPTKSKMKLVRVVAFVLIAAVVVYLINHV